ncbi:MAG: PIN domain-containing protein [Planctomycetes bacterium]|nr:PIN domain-containing protein [Planctomycetota bacterium]
MKMLLDTSVLVAGMLSDHAHHSVAWPWLERAKAGAFEFVVAGHSLAELYAVLTKLPRRPRISPGMRCGWSMKMWYAGRR